MESTIDRSRLQPGSDLTPAPKKGHKSVLDVKRASLPLGNAEAPESHSTSTLNFQWLNYKPIINKILYQNSSDPAINNEAKYRAIRQKSAKQLCERKNIAYKQYLDGEALPKCATVKQLALRKGSTR